MNASVHKVDARSADLATDPRMLEHYQRDGVIQLGNFISESLRMAVADDLEALIVLRAAAFGVDVSCNDGCPHSDRVNCLSQQLISLCQAVEGSQSAVYDAISHMPSLHAVAADRFVLETVRALVGQPVSIHHRLILLMSMPDNEWHLPLWHQDWYYNAGPYSTLTLYAPLQRTNVTNGSLLVAMGEHEVGMLPHGEFEREFQTKWHTIDPQCTAPFERVADTSLEAGDALVFNSLVPHSARINRSNDVRFVMNLRFVDMADSAFARSDWKTSPAQLQQARQALARKSA